MKIRFVSSLLVCLVASTGIAMPAARAQNVREGQNLSAFKKVARLKTLQEKGKNYSAEVTYPIYRTRTRLARFANAQIYSQVVPPFRDWLRSAKKDSNEFASASVPYDYQLSPSSFFVTRRLISTRLDAYQFTGGAHGMAAMIPLNFGVVEGKPKTLNLGDFFRSGSPYRTLVQTKVIGKLRKNPAADWIHDGSVKKLETVQFNNFLVERDGLRWLFNQYEMGSYASGQIEVKLSLSELGPNFRRDWLR